MNSKPIIMLGMVIGSSIGSSIPLLWGVGWLSITSVVFSMLGGLVGIWLAFRLTQY